MLETGNNLKQAWLVDGRDFGDRKSKAKKTELLKDQERGRQRNTGDVSRPTSGNRSEA